mgnify:FL=1
MLFLKESEFGLKEKNTTQHWFSYCQIACKYLKTIMTDPLNFILTISVL